jgi:hypothetical protein
MNTATVRHTCFDFVSNLCSMFNVIREDGGVPKTDTDRTDIPKEELVEYIYDTIPAFKGLSISEPKGWKCLEQVLPFPMFNQGDLVVWNDAYISPTHGTRACFKGDEPLTVRIVDDFIVAVVRDEKGRLVTKAPRINRITLETPSGWVIIAHPGYFKLFQG